jgi:methyltransferase
VLTRLVVCAGMGAARLLELVLSNRNIEQNDGAQETKRNQSVYSLIVVLHAATIAGTFVLGSKASKPWMFMLLAVQPIRAWVLVTLGKRWNTRGAVSPAMEVETGGPYSHVRHPNYAVVLVELLALPMAFQAKKLAIVATVANAALLTVRIREEEALLMQLPGYEEHFGAKKRFFPGVL